MLIRLDRRQCNPEFGKTCKTVRCIDCARTGTDLHNRRHQLRQLYAKDQPDHQERYKRSRMYIGLAFLDDKYRCTSVLPPHGVLMKIIQGNNGIIKQLDSPFTPVVGAYSNESTGIVKVWGLGGALGISPTSGAP
jgi:hypothetical protein